MFQSVGAQEFFQLVHDRKVEEGSGAGADDCTLVSIAISAKRQADALERIASAFDQQSASGNVLFWLERIAYSLDAAAAR